MLYIFIRQQESDVLFQQYNTRPHDPCAIQHALQTRLVSTPTILYYVQKTEYNVSRGSIQHLQDCMHSRVQACADDQSGIYILLILCTANKFFILESST